jgi:hypothetical protein
MFLCILIFAVGLIAGCGDIDNRGENINPGFAGQFQVNAVQSINNLEDAPVSVSPDKPQICNEKLTEKATKELGAVPLCR